MTYLDHAATSPLRPAVAEAMAPFGSAVFGNASGSHQVARRARRALDDARERVAQVVGADPGEVVFTSGGTESDNLAVFGTLAALAESGSPCRAIVCSAVEHAAVLASCQAVATSSARLRGIEPVEVRSAPVDAGGALDVGALEELLTDDVALVSVMLANNEVGTIQPLPAVAALVARRAPRAVLHTDAVQAAAYLDLAAAARDAQLVSLSAHKLGGPKGVGALIVRDPARVGPILHGGGHERDRRSGTSNVGGAVGLAVALEEIAAVRDEEGSRVAALRDRLAGGIISAVPGAVLSVDLHRCLPGHAHFRFGGVEREELLVLLDERGVCASGGAACSSGALEPSHVLAAMGVPPDEARGAIRFSLGHTTTESDVDAAVEAVRSAVAELRA
ncbi:MAG TPA: cysteine desulfurase family protein [Acidimicrobiales bacterium]